MNATTRTAGSTTLALEALRAELSGLDDPSAVGGMPRGAPTPGVVVPGTAVLPALGTNWVTPGGVVTAEPGDVSVVEAGVSAG
jgi:hypothetical protein